MERSSDITCPHNYEMSNCTQMGKFVNRMLPIFLWRVNRSYFPERGRNTREIEMAAEDRGSGWEGEGEECNFCSDTKIFDAISAVPRIFKLIEPSRLFCWIKSLCSALNKCFEWRKKDNANHISASNPITNVYER